MAEKQNAVGGESLIPAEGEKIPVMQSIMDNPFLLLFIGVAVPAVFYLIWGIMDIIMIPVAK